MKHPKFMATLLSLSLLCNITPIRSYAQPHVDPVGKELETGKLFYLNHGDHIEITGTKPVSGDALVIPEEIDGLPVTVIAENAFEQTSYTKVIWSPTIPVISAGVFNNCKSLYTLILPDTVTKIEEGAFTGCESFGDIFFAGDTAAWDGVCIKSGNEAFENANVHLEYGWTDEKAEFVAGEDNWSFSNHDLTQYLLQKEFVERITADFCPEFQSRVQQWTEQLNSEYNGACGGMAAISFLVSHGVLQPSDIYEGAETLYEIPLCDESVQMITYYWNMVCVDGRVNGLLDAAEISYEELPDILQNGTPAYFTYFIEDTGIHAVVAYGIEQGEWMYNDTVYTGRFLAYDNNLIDSTDDGHMYFTDGFEEIYIPYWGNQEKRVSFSTGVVIDPLYFPYSLNMGKGYASTYVLGDLNTDNTIDAADAAVILTAAAASGSGTDTGLNNGYKSAADVNDDGVFDATDAAKVLEYAAYAGSGGELEFEEYLSQ